MASFLIKPDRTEASVVAATVDEYNTSALRVQPPVDIARDALFAIQQSTGVRITQLAVGGVSSIYDCAVVDTTRGAQFDTNEARVWAAASEIADIAGRVASETFFAEQFKGKE